MDGIFDFLDEIEQIADSMTAEAELCGEISDELKAQLDAVQLEKKAKAEQLCLKYKERKYIAEAKKAEAKKLSEDAAIMEKANERLRDYIAFLLEGEKLETARVKVSYRLNPPSATILDEAKIPAEFWKPGKPTIGKTEIKEAIEKGQNVPGAILERKKSTKIS